MRKRTRYRQPPLKGGRDPLFSCVLPATRAAAIARAQQFNVSSSWVVATILADALGVANQLDYRYGAAGRNKRKA